VFDPSTFESLTSRLIRSFISSASRNVPIATTSSPVTSVTLTVRVPSVSRSVTTSRALPSTGRWTIAVTS